MLESLSQGDGIRFCQRRKRLPGVYPCTLQHSVILPGHHMNETLTEFAVKLYTFLYRSRVERGVAKTMLATQLLDWHSGLGCLQKS
jgi:hypothetical protein